MSRTAVGDIALQRIFIWKVGIAFYGLAGQDGVFRQLAEDSASDEY